MSVIFAMMLALVVCEGTRQDQHVHEEDSDYELVEYGDFDINDLVDIADPIEHEWIHVEEKRTLEPQLIVEMPTALNEDTLCFDETILLHELLDQAHEVLVKEFGSVSGELRTFPDMTIRGIESSEDVEDKLIDSAESSETCGVMQILSGVPDKIEDSSEIKPNAIFDLMKGAQTSSNHSTTRPVIEEGLQLPQNADIADQTFPPSFDAVVQEPVLSNNAEAAPRPSHESEGTWFNRSPSILDVLRSRTGIEIRGRLLIIHKRDGVEALDMVKHGLQLAAPWAALTIQALLSKD